jgi:hypothetical protein
MLLYQNNPNGWSGQLINLLAQLNVHKPTGETNWPKSAKGMGDALRRLSPAIRTLGFDCKSNQKLGGTITWSITPVSNKLPLACPASTASTAITGETYANTDASPDSTLDTGHSVLEGHGFDSFDAGS